MKQNRFFIILFVQYCCGNIERLLCTKKFLQFVTYFKSLLRLTIGIIEIKRNGTKSPEGYTQALRELRGSTCKYVQKTSRFEKWKQKRIHNKTTKEWVCVSCMWLVVCMFENVFLIMCVPKYVCVWKCVCSKMWVSENVCVRKYICLKYSRARVCGVCLIDVYALCNIE